MLIRFVLKGYTIGSCTCRLTDATMPHCSMLYVYDSDDHLPTFLLQCWQQSPGVHRESVREWASAGCAGV